MLLGFGLYLNTLTPSHAKEKAASVSSEVAAGKWTGARLRDLPKGATLAFQVTVDGDVTVLLLDEQSYRRLPTIDRPLFRGKTGQRMRFSVVVPQTGHYYAVIDNRVGQRARKFTIEINAAAGAKTRPRQSVDEQLGTITNALRQTFIVDALVIRSIRCGEPDAYSGPNGVVICSEYARELLDRLGNERKAADALMFVLFHEVGHVLLRQWDYPAYDNEEVADEFATVMMVMFMGEQRARSQAEYLASRDSASAGRQNLRLHDRQPLSAQRARNILDWVDDPALVYNWQPVLVPHMQTAFLERLEAKSPSWMSHALVEQELQRRE